MGFCVDGNAMDCDTSDQWSGIELLRVLFLTLTFFQQNFQALIPHKGKRFDSISGRVRQKRICHHPLPSLRFS